MLKSKLQNLLADMQARPQSMQEAPIQQDPLAQLKQMATQLGQSKAGAAAQEAQAPQQPSLEGFQQFVGEQPANQEAPQANPVEQVKQLASNLGQKKAGAAAEAVQAPQGLPAPEQLAAAQQPQAPQAFASEMDDAALAQALDEQRQLQRQALLARAAGGLGDAAMLSVGRTPTNSNDMYNALDEYAKGATNKVLARRKGASEEESLKQSKAKTFDDADAMAKADPNSDISKSVRNWAKKRGFNISDNVSVNQMQSILPLYLKDIESQEKREDRKLAAAEKADAKAKLKTEGLTKGQEALDRDFAKEYNDWTSGGQAALDKNLQRLEEAKAILKKRSGDMFGTSGRVVGNLPDFMRSEESKRIRQDVQAAAQGALRATLGPQFTENEGIRIMNMAYDETLSPQENIRKIEAAVKELKTQKDNKNAKVKQFEQKGTLAGFKSEANEPSESVNIQAPNGKVHSIPRNQAEAAIKAGGKLVQ